jgi:hypothetical protein
LLRADQHVPQHTLTPCCCLLCCRLPTLLCMLLLCSS